MSHSLDVLSPPARGSPSPRTPPPTWRGPIPARAGEPIPNMTWRTPGAAYPRPRGGAVYEYWRSRHSLGLSPPARGSPSTGSRRSMWHGPIPARAGEPLPSHTTTLVATAYPRPRGGAWSAWLHIADNPGLSPPARGSLPAQVPASPGGRPIPARAGEPSSSTRSVRADPAYPRPRGGAPRVRTCPSSSYGLSPPARGSQNRLNRGGRHLRPIPARAGEPRRPPRAACAHTAYPRRRGGAPSRATDELPDSGLSPPARGSLFGRESFEDILVGYRGCSGRESSDVSKGELGGSAELCLTSSTPSASQISFGGSPSWRTLRLPDAEASRYTIVIAPRPRKPNHFATTVQIRSRTPLEMSEPT